MADPTEFTFNNVTQENADRLKHYIEKYGGSVSGLTEGVVENECFTLDYRYSPIDHALEIKPKKMLPIVTPAALRRSIKRLLELPATESPILTTTDFPTPTDQSCGVYLWIYGFVANKTALPLSLQGNYDTANCIATTLSTPLLPGTSITSTSTPVFKLHGHKNTFNTGACKLQYLIGQDELTVTFQMQDNSPPDDISVNATFGGTRFTAENTTHAASFDSGAAASDLYIYLEIDNAS